MKALIIAVMLVATQGFAANNYMIPVQFGNVHRVGLSELSKFRNPRIVSFEIDLANQTGSYPLVLIDDKSSKNCSHKQTLIVFSSYDLVARLHKRTYEVQIERSSLTEKCVLKIFASASKADQQNAAVIGLLP